MPFSWSLPLSLLIREASFEADLTGVRVASNTRDAIAKAMSVAP